MNIELNQEEAKFLYRVVNRTIEFCKMGIENKNMKSDFTNDLRSVEILLNKLKVFIDAEPKARNDL